MLICSGSDLVGKSTFCKRALEALNDLGYPHMLQHLSRPPASFDSYEGYINRLYRYNVWDRFHLDELMYRQHDDRPSEMTPLKYRLIDAEVIQHGGFVVVLIASEQQVRERYAKRGDPMYDIEHILKVNNSYHQLTHDDFVTMRSEMYAPLVDHIVSDIDQWAGVIEEYISHLEEFEELS